MTCGGGGGEAFLVGGGGVGVVSNQSYATLIDWW